MRTNRYLKKYPKQKFIFLKLLKKICRVNECS